jgi:hypothetical protein
MKRITRDVHPDRVRDLLDRVPRATIAFTDGGQVEAAPVAFAFTAGCQNQPAVIEVVPESAGFVARPERHARC